MSDLGDVLELLHTSAERWDSLRLQGHEWRHIATLNRAFEHEMGQTGGGPISSIQFRTNDVEADESNEEWRLWVAKPNKTRTQFQVGSETVTAVFAGNNWWSWTTSGYRTNNGDVNTSHGLGPAEGLFNPATHVGWLQLRVDDRATFLSRPAYLVSAIPRVADRHGFNPAPHMLGLGADSYKLVVDAELGILLRCQAEFEGAAFRVIEVDELAANEQLGESLFDPAALRNQLR